MESRGNGISCETGGLDTFGSTLHWGPGFPYDAYLNAHAEYKNSESLGEDFHTYELEWTKTGIKTFIDGETVLDVDMTEENMF